MPNATRRTYSVNEVAEMLGCSPSKVRELVNQGVIPRVPHLGRKVLIPRAALEAKFPDVWPPAPTGTVTTIDGPVFQ